jgi:Co/Zn/Cd efflux system component
MGEIKDVPKSFSPTNPKPKKAKKGCKLTKTTMLIIIIIMTSAFFLVELIVGHITKSNALTADAFHMLSDIIALVWK